jgi:hypothetical protein
MISKNPTAPQPTIPSALKGTICEPAITNARVQGILREYPELDDFECTGHNECKMKLRFKAGLHDTATELQGILQPTCPLVVSTKI